MNGLRLEFLDGTDLVAKYLGRSSGVGGRYEGRHDLWSGLVSDRETDGGQTSKWM